MSYLPESLKLIEDKRGDLRDIVRQYIESVHEYIYGICDLEEARSRLLDQLRHLVLEVYELIREHRKRIWSEYKIDIESRPPQLLGADQLYTGQ